MQKTQEPRKQLAPALLRAKDVCAMLGIGKSMWWQGVKDGRFPAPVKLGPRTTAWRSRDIQALIDNGVVESEKGAS